MHGAIDDSIWGVTWLSNGKVCITLTVVEILVIVDFDPSVRPDEGTISLTLLLLSILNPILHFNNDLENLKTQHCHWCITEIVSPII